MCSQRIEESDTIRVSTQIHQIRATQSEQVSSNIVGKQARILAKPVGYQPLVSFFYGGTGGDVTETGNIRGLRGECGYVER